MCQLYINRAVENIFVSWTVFQFMISKSNLKNVENKQKTSHIILTTYILHFN